MARAATFGSLRFAMVRSRSSPSQETMPADLLKSLLLCLFSGLVLTAAFTDLISYTIPNWVSAGLALAFAPAAMIAGVSLPAMVASLVVGLVVLAVGIALFSMKWFGGGDVKLLAAASPWIGLSMLPRFFFFTGLAGGILALALLIARTAWVRPLVSSGPAWMRRLATPGGDTPYGVAIALGALAAFPSGLVMRLGHVGA